MAKRSFSRLVKIVTGGQTGGAEEFSPLERFVHFWVLVGQSFARNRCPVRAAALSYTSLLALIPLLAVAISVTSGLLKSEGEQKIYAAIDKFVSNVMPPAPLNTTNPAAPLNLSPGQSIMIAPTNSITAVTNGVPSAEHGTRMEAAQKVVARNIHTFIQNTRSGALGVVGMLLLVYLAVSMLANIENTFNDIWGVARGRNWLWRIVLYWATITLGPLLIAGALALTSGTYLKTTQHLVEHTPLVGRVLFQFLPLLVLWLAFALVYLLVPNTRVKLNAALAGGLVGGLLWHLNNLFGFIYVSRVVTNSKIYGGLGLVPVFMIGLYFSWLILLFGAEVAHAFQNRKLYAQEKLAESVNQRGREFIALRLMTLIGQRFQQGEPPAALPQISAELGISARLTRQVLQPLLAARLVAEMAGAEPAYQPARPLDAINAYHVLRAVRGGDGVDIATRDEPARAEVLGEFAKIEEAERDTASRVTLLALVNRSQKQIEDSSANKLTKSE